MLVSACGLDPVGSAESATEAEKGFTITLSDDLTVEKLSPVEWNIYKGVVLAGTVALTDGSVLEALEKQQNLFVNKKLDGEADFRYPTTYILEHVKEKGIIQTNHFFIYPDAEKKVEEIEAKDKKAKDIQGKDKQASLEVYHLHFHTPWIEEEMAFQIAQSFAIK